jgi:hypothetical protein
LGDDGLMMLIQVAAWLCFQLPSVAHTNIGWHGQMLAQLCILHVKSEILRHQPLAPMTSGCHHAHWRDTTIQLFVYAVAAKTIHGYGQTFNTKYGVY